MGVIILGGAVVFVIVTLNSPGEIFSGLFCVLSFILGLIGGVVLLHGYSLPKGPGAFYYQPPHPPPLYSSTPPKKLFPNRYKYAQPLQWYLFPPPRLRKTTYGAFYMQPERSPRIRLDKILLVMVMPRKSFMDIYHDTTKVQGIFITIIFTSLFVVLSMMIYAFIGNSGYPLNLFNIESIFDNPLIFIAYTTAPLFIIGLYLTGNFSADFAGKIGGYTNSNKTIGLLGYGAVVYFILGLMLTLIPALFTNMNPNINNESNNYLFDRGFIIFFVLIILVWIFWVNGSAVSVANDISIPRGILSYFFGLFIAGLITFTLLVILIIILAAFLGGI